MIDIPRVQVFLISLDSYIYPKYGGDDIVCLVWRVPRALRGSQGSGIDPGQSPDGDNAGLTSWSHA
jgi:hypothetical protein